MNPKTKIIKTRAEYDATAALNCSLSKEILKSPAHGLAYLNRQREETKALRVGSAVHKLALEGLHEFNAAYATAPELDRRTKDGKAAFEAFTLANAGKTILSPDESALVAAVAASAAACMRNRKIALTQTELMFATEYEGTPIKAALDGVSESDGFIYDLKTTEDASPAGFLKAVRSYRYNLQAYFYRFAYEVAFGIRAAGFRFLVVEKEPPFAVAVYELGPELMSYAVGDFEAALKAYKTATALDEWPAYPDEIKVIDITTTKTASTPIQFA